MEEDDANRREEEEREREREEREARHERAYFHPSFCSGSILCLERRKEKQKLNPPARKVRIEKEDLVEEIRAVPAKPSHSSFYYFPCLDACRGLPPSPSCPHPHTPTLIPS